MDCFICDKSEERGLYFHPNFFCMNCIQYLMQKACETITNMGLAGHYFDPTEDYSLEFHPLDNEDDEAFYQDEVFDDFCDQTDGCECDSCRYYQEKN